MSIEQAIDKFLKKVKKDIIADQQSKGMVASGDSAASLEVKTTQNSGQLLGSDYFYYQVHGRAAGKWPPRDPILKWINQKGIQSDISAESLAFLIQRKIGEEGTDIHLGKKQGIDLDNIIEKNFDLFLQDVSKGIADKFVTDIFI